ncbi:29714_t:CDS:1, partial [Racocetra persica]
WMKAGLGKSQVEFAAHLRKKGYRPNTSNIKEIIKKDSWHNIHKGFREPNSMTN